MATKRYKYEIGQKFNKLTILSYNSEKKGYNVQCECGNITCARGHSLVKGTHKMCFTCAMGRKSKTTALPNDLGSKKEIYRNYKRAAAKRKYCFDLSENIFFELIESNCHYCGNSPSLIWKRSRRKHIILEPFLYNGIDRVNNDIGYTEDNCVACCGICNNSKACLSEDRWFEWIERIYNYQTKNVQRLS